MSQLSVAEIHRMLSGAASADLPEIISRLSPDPRLGVRDAIGRAQRRLDRELAEHARLERMAELQISLHASGYVVVAGVDEVGRGCLAGPVSAGAVVLNAETRIQGLDDSKRLTPEMRVHMDAEIRASALAIAVAHVDPILIDGLGIAAANLLAMRRAVAALGVPVDHVIVDGLPVDMGVVSTAVVGGDRRVSAIAAASIVAKVARDAMMRDFDEQFPEYGFGANKGYGTVEHIETIRRIGPCVLHRMSFAPCSQNALF
ncbi:MAG: ribonuclease HII [Actinobacteria bacterium HGW-Actinobacteria-6]|jgi:ribonuclease HII|nr:MAG: ribonuclease HII [Actinobacteria bacterium HGW-Actinobacteria-6]